MFHSDVTSTDAPTDDTAEPVGLDRAEAALVEHYPRLVRLAYLVLPHTLGRQRRVLTAHAIAQRALPRGSSERDTPPTLPAQRGGTDAGYAYLRRRVLRAALDARTGTKRDERIFLRADEKVAYGDLMEVMNLLRSAGYLKIALVGLETTGGVPAPAAPGAEPSAPAAPASPAPAAAPTQGATP